MHIIEQRNTLVLTNGEGSPRRQLVLQLIFVAPVALAVLATQLSAAMHGWVWGWLTLAIAATVLLAFARACHQRCHATVEIDRCDGRVRLERRFPTRTLSEELSLGDVADLEVELARGHKGARRFAPVLALRDGRRISLGPARSDRAPIDRAIDTLRTVL